MMFDASLSRSGYILREPEGIWLRPGYEGIAYSDGESVEGRMGAIIAGASDLSVLSADLARHCVDWVSHYHLCSNRANILRPFGELLIDRDVLEIGAGCGALTRYLGECGARVLALEGTPRRAAIARSRTRDLDKVTVVADRFDGFSCADRFDIVTLIGVLEYAPMFTAGDDPVVRMLEQAREMLKSDGTLIVAIENQLGLKYFAGCAEDHLGQAMYGIEGRYGSGEPRTFGRKELVALLERAGFADQEFLAPFPDYKMPVSIITEQGFACDTFDAGALAWQSTRSDLQLPRHLALAPELAWPVVAANGLALDLANSFLVLARKTPRASLGGEILAYHYSTAGRLAAYCKETRFIRQENGTIDLQYLRLGPDQLQAASGRFRFSVPARADYVTGTALSRDLIRIVTRDGWTMEELGRALGRFLRIIEGFVVAQGGNLLIESEATPLPGACFDLVPQNIIISTDGGWRVIDQEWGLTETMPAGWLLFRTLLGLVSSLTRFGRPGSEFLRTRSGFITAVFEQVGMPVDTLQLLGYGTLEAGILGEVRGVAVPETWWGPDEPLACQLLHEVSAERGDEIVHLEQRNLDHKAELDGLNQAISLRDARIAALSRTVQEYRRRIEARTPGCMGGRIRTRLPRLVDRGMAALAAAMPERLGLGALLERYTLRKALTQHPLLDVAWYLAQHFDADEIPIDPVRHYCSRGVNERRNPNPHFHTAWYLQEYPDVDATGKNALLHYIQYGAAEGRNPNPYFDTRWYLDHYPEVEAQGMNPLVHYLQHGPAGRANPNPYFDTGWYLQRYKDIARNGLDPLLHYVLFGADEGRDPGPCFRTRWYLREYPDVEGTGMNPLLHFLRHGVYEGRHPCPAVSGTVSQGPIRADDCRDITVGKDITGKPAGTATTCSTRVASVNKAGAKEYRVLIVADLQVPALTKYRVTQKVEMLERLGVPCSVFDWRDAKAAIAAMPHHCLLILYRIPAFSKGLDLLVEAVAQQITTAWETDDLVFDRDLLAGSRTLAALEPDVREAMLDGAPLLRRAMLICDRGIASTPGLAEAMRRAGVTEVDVVENALDEQTMTLAERIRAERGAREEDVVRIVYGSGSNTHNIDFQEAAGAVLHMLEAFPNVRFRIVGQLALPPGFTPYRDRVERMPLCSFAEYLRFLGEGDISIAPLEEHPFNEAKSNIKYIEASILGLPSVCSPRASFRQVVSHGVNGYLCATQEDWIDALAMLVQDKPLRGQVGGTAHRLVLDRYSPDKIAQQQLMKALRL